MPLCNDELSDPEPAPSTQAITHAAAHPLSEASRLQPVTLESAIAEEHQVLSNHRRQHWTLLFDDANSSD